MIFAANQSLAISGCIIRSPALTHGFPCLETRQRSSSHWSVSMMAAAMGKYSFRIDKHQRQPDFLGTPASKHFENCRLRALSGSLRKVTSTAKSDTQPCGDTLGKQRQEYLPRRETLKSGSPRLKKQRAQIMTPTGANIEPETQLRGATGSNIGPDKRGKPHKCVDHVGSNNEPQVVYQHGGLSNE